MNRQEMINYMEENKDIIGYKIVQSYPIQKIAVRILESICKENFCDKYKDHEDCNVLNIVPLMYEVLHLICENDEFTDEMLDEIYDKTMIMFVSQYLACNLLKHLSEVNSFK